MSEKTLKSIFDMCLSVLNTPINMLGYRVTLVKFLMFELVAGIVLWSILHIFSRD